MKLESANDELSRELLIYRSKRGTLDYCSMNTLVSSVCIRELGYIYLAVFFTAETELFT